MDRYETPDGDIIFAAKLEDDIVRIQTDTGEYKVSLWTDRVIAGIAIMHYHELPELMDNPGNWITLKRS